MPTCTTRSLTRRRKTGRKQPQYPKNGGAGQPAPPFFVLRPLDRIPWSRIDGPFQPLWAKNGKYEYCYLFSNSQNSPICCPHGLQAPLNYSNSSIAGLYVLRLMNVFSVMSIILCRQYDTTIATVLIFAIFCPQGLEKANRVVVGDVLKRPVKQERPQRLLKNGRLSTLILRALI